jgi:hypothetical protein
MKQHSIISRGESMRILANDLRKIALKKHAAELSEATAAERQGILQRIEQDIQKELRRRLIRREPDSLLH